MMMQRYNSSLILVARISFFLSFIMVFANAFANAQFQQGLEFAKSLKDQAWAEALKFNPEEVFKDQKGGYTKQPLQTEYYQDVTQTNTQVLEKAAREEILKDEDYKSKDGRSVPTPGKTVFESFKTRELYKINQQAEFMQKGKLITDNAHNIVMGESNKHIDCEKQKLSTCKTVQIEKTCNEEVRTVQRVCEKTPNVSSSIKEIAYPNCQHLVITQHENTPCPSGYSQILSTDMVYTEDDHWDDIRFCTKSITANEVTECYSGGYYIATTVAGYFGSQRATVPKKFRSRIRISNNYFQNLQATIINETTGQTLYHEEQFVDGQVIELPYSDTQDQTFRFYAISPGWFIWGRARVGVMVLYIDSRYMDREAHLESWQEVCYDI